MPTTCPQTPVCTYDRIEWLTVNDALKWQSARADRQNSDPATSWRGRVSRNGGCNAPHIKQRNVSLRRAAQIFGFRFELNKTFRIKELLLKDGVGVLVPGIFLVRAQLRVSGSASYHQHRCKD